MELNIRQPEQKQLDDAAQFYGENGFLLLSGMEELIARQFRLILARTIGISEDQMEKVLDPIGAAEIFPAEIRQQLARVPTPKELAQLLLDSLRPILQRLIGPLVHVSSSFHAQFKGGEVQAVDHGGYNAEMEYMEVHGPYLLHQDFAGASIPTSPSMLTLWVSLNSTPCWNLRLFSRSHKLGLLCNTWLNLQDQRLPLLGNPVDVQARKGTAVLFNGLTLHGTSNPGPERRVSCDIRFFPLCPFLPTEVHLLNPRLNETLTTGLKHADTPTLRAPLLEDLVFLGEESRTRLEEPALNEPRPYSVYNWVHYISCVLRGDSEAALTHLKRFVNTELGVDGPEVYIEKFHGKPVSVTTLRSLRAQVARIMPDAELKQLDLLIQQLSNVSGLTP